MVFVAPCFLNNLVVWIAWAKEEVKLFGNMMRRQLYGLAQNDPVYVAGVEAGLGQTVILIEGAMDFRNVLRAELQSVL